MDPLKSNIAVSVKIIPMIPYFVDPLSGGNVDSCKPDDGHHSQIL